MVLRYVREIPPNEWLTHRLHPLARDAGSVVPEGFEAYARVFHPATGTTSDLPVTWREIATANRRIVHPEMQFGNIAGTWSRRNPQPGLWSDAPRSGTLSLDLARAIVAILRAHTATSERCWFAAWEGWGDLTPPVHVPRLELAQRRYYLAEGPIEDAMQSVNGRQWSFQSASMWWSDDRSWFVSTEVDLSWTYVGGPTECIDQLLADPRIEALPARPSDGITYDSDSINPSPPRP